MQARALDQQLEGHKLTPMLQQYVDAKRAAPDNAILLFRMGDFFELFFDDAVVASKELELTLTSRDKDKANPIPMAGVPHHAVTGYIARLVERGFTVAVCDQVEDPKTAKGIVKRDITRLVTPGTVSDLDALDPGAASYLGCVQIDGDEYVLALLDLLAGEVLCTRCAPDEVPDEVQRMGVRELLLPAQDAEPIIEAIRPLGIAMRQLEEDTFDPSAVAAWLTDRFGSADLQGRETSTNQNERFALYALLSFAESTQRRRLRHLMPPRAYQVADFVVIDESTRRNLELTRTLSGDKRGALLWHLDRCRTAVGSRTLSQWLLFPLRDKLAIEARLDIVGSLRDARTLREDAQGCLDGVRDIERLVGRVAVGRAGPKDLGALRASLLAVPELKRLLANAETSLGRLWTAADEAKELREDLVCALVDEPPFTANDGGIFARGWREDLDELIELSTEGHDFLASLERRERERTGIPKLKVRYNKVFGYYIEISRASLKNVPDDYIRKQTLVNAERFFTPELKDYETKVLGADERRKAREQELFEDLVGRVASFTTSLRALSRLIAQTDALLSLAQVAEEGRYSRPLLTDEPVLQLRASRHPVVERLMPGGERFVPNDVDIDGKHRQLLIVTGPNMAGKSTVMRQVALISLLAHVGSYVPAKVAKVGLTDRIFTRVGASDNLGRGHSTFMVEMIETGAILRYATDRSIVILDEIGRGTSTFDGVSIAWAVAEYVHDRLRCRTLFATHYHELTDLALQRERIVNVSVAVKEERGTIAFLRRLVEGAANRSYGIEVARLAGLPDAVLERAREVLKNLESGELDEEGMPALATGKRGARRHQMSLFSPPAPTEPPPHEPPGPGKSSNAQEIERALAQLDPLHMTPMDALRELDRLKKMLDE